MEGIHITNSDINTIVNGEREFATCDKCKRSHLINVFVVFESDGETGRCWDELATDVHCICGNDMFELAGFRHASTHWRLGL